MLCSVLYMYPLRFSRILQYRTVRSFLSNDVVYVRLFICLQFMLTVYFSDG